LAGSLTGALASDLEKSWAFNLAKVLYSSMLLLDISAQCINVPKYLVKKDSTVVEVLMINETGIAPPLARQERRRRTVCRIRFCRPPLL
jgi:hypothetical protein